MTILCQQTHWFTSSGYENVHRVSSPSQRLFVRYRRGMFHQIWNQTTHIILYALMFAFTRHKQAPHTPFCSFSGDLTVSQAHRVHRCRYISKVHVHNTSLSVFYSSFTNLQSFDQNSIKPWTEKSGSSTSEVKRKGKKTLLSWCEMVIYLWCNSCFFFDPWLALISSELWPLTLCCYSYKFRSSPVFPWGSHNLIYFPFWNFYKILRLIFMLCNTDDAGCPIC